LGCALRSLGQPEARVKIGRHIVSRKNSIRVYIYRVNNFFVCGPKYAKFFSPNGGGVVDDQELFRVLIC